MRTPLALLVVAIAACSGAAPSNTPTLAPAARPHVLEGTIYVDAGSRGLLSGAPCQPESEDLDLGDEGEILVRDGANAIIAKGKLSAAGYSESLVHCAFTFAFGEIPPSDFYQLDIGGRAGPVWSEADLDSDGWVEVLILATNARTDPRATPIPVGTIETVYACSEPFYGRFTANVAGSASGPFQLEVAESGIAVVTLTLQEEYRKPTPLATGLFYVVLGPSHDFSRETEKGHVYDMDLSTTGGEPVARGTYDCTQKIGS